MARFIIWSLILFFAQWTWAGRNIVLVPGFFNSAIPAPEQNGHPWKQPYFSQEIVQSLIQTGDHVLVVDNLNPVGDITENGERLIRFLEKQQTQFVVGPVILVAHSAGGLYSLYALTHSTIRIDQLVTVSTPFRGLSFLQTMVDHHIPLEELMAPFCLRNLTGLLDYQVTAFLRTVKITRPVKIDVFAGHQEKSLRVWDYRFLSAPLRIFQTLADGPSDGIVTIRSSLDVSVLQQQNTKAQIQIHTQLLPLEHWEQVADASMFRLLGVGNIGGLRAEQSKMYKSILPALLK